MQIKRYEVSSITEALAKIKEDLGPNAIILSAKKINGLSGQALEVMAARDEKNPPLEKNSSDFSSSGSKRLIGGQEDILRHFNTEITKLREDLLAGRRELSLGRELAELKETMEKFFDVLGARKGKASQDVSTRIYYRLLANGFSRASACGIMETVAEKITAQAQLDEEKAMRIVEEHIVNSLPATEEVRDEKRIKAFIGATGVGKTTTLAKLAARYAIMKKMKVGLITTDTYRLAATEQLKTYAKIMGLKMEVASSETTFQKALQMFADKDVILVDTPGRSRADDGDAVTRGILRPRNDLETHLLLSATASPDHLQDSIVHYATYNYDRLILTKIDESRRFGSLYDVVDRARKPVSFFTCGQNVPQDIEEVTPRKMVDLFMKSGGN